MCEISSEQCVEYSPGLLSFQIPLADDLRLLLYRFRNRVFLYDSLPRSGNVCRS